MRPELLIVSAFKIGKWPLFLCFFIFFSQIFAQKSDPQNSPVEVPDETITQITSDGKTTQYQFSNFFEQNTDGSAIIVGVSLVNGKENPDFDNFLRDYNRETFQKLSRVEQEKMLEILVAYRGLPLRSDPVQSQKIAKKQSDILSTELGALSRDRQVQIYMRALSESFWEEKASTDLIIKELLREKEGLLLAGELLCTHSAQYIQNSALQYGEPEDAELAGKKLKKLFLLHPKLKATTCEVKGVKVDLGQIALSAEIQGRSVEIDRQQEANLRISEDQKAKLREVKKTLSCDSANLARVFRMSVDHLADASQGVQSYISAKMDSCVLEGRLVKEANGQYFFKFGFSDQLRGEKVNLIDLAKEWGLNIRLPAPPAVPASGAKPQKGKAGP